MTLCVCGGGAKGVVTEMSLDEQNQFVKFFFFFFKVTSSQPSNSLPFPPILLIFFDTNINIDFLVLTTTVHYKPNDSHSCISISLSKHFPQCYTVFSNPPTTQIVFERIQILTIKPMYYWTSSRLAVTLNSFSTPGSYHHPPPQG